VSDRHSDSGEPVADGGLLATLKAAAATLLGAVHTRFELLVSELEEERVRLLRLALFALIALFFLALGVVMATLFVVVLFWDSQRLLVIGLLTVVYVAAGVIVAQVARRDAQGRGRLFAASLGELKKDRERLLP
jgi:uncharacterized membrane protein YqjE